MQSPASYKVIGMMSGTSLDGLDIAACVFRNVDGRWEYEIEHCKSISYPEYWHTKLQQLSKATATDLAEAHSSYGNWLSTKVNEFCQESGFLPDLIASHGHTVKHDPDRAYTCQIGHGGVIAKNCRLPVVCDFRSEDVALGGQGAPLVPGGEIALFSGFDFCINLGGIANITCMQSNPLIAYDVLPCNIVMNHIANKRQLAYDRDGIISRMGNVNKEMLNKLESMGYYHRDAPKSLDKDVVIQDWLPVIDSFHLTPEDEAATWCKHVSNMLIRAVNAHAPVSDTNRPKVLISGGGAFHPLIREYLQNAESVHIEFPDEQIICYKEALIFAFLGLLKMLGRNNILASVTGAAYDHSSGAVYGDTGLRKYP